MACVAALTWRLGPRPAVRSAAHGAAWLALRLTRSRCVRSRTAEPRCAPAPLRSLQRTPPRCCDAPPLCNTHTHTRTHARTHGAMRTVAAGAWQQLQQFLLALHGGTRRVTAARSGGALLFREALDRLAVRPGDDAGVGLAAEAHSEDHRRRRKREIPAPKARAAPSARNRAQQRGLGPARRGAQCDAAWRAAARGAARFERLGLQRRGARCGPHARRGERARRCRGRPRTRAPPRLPTAAAGPPGAGSRRTGSHCAPSACPR